MFLFLAILTIESESFGKVRIKHYKSHYYICMNAKGDIIGLVSNLMLQFITLAYSGFGMGEGEEVRLEMLFLDVASTDSDYNFVQIPASAEGRWDSQVWQHFITVYG